MNMTQNKIPPATASSSVTRLAVVTETWPPEVNGVANTIFQLVSGLLQREDYQIQLIRPQQQSKQSVLSHERLEETLTGSLTLPFYKEVKLGLPQYFYLKKHWTEQRPDIVQIVTEGPLGYAALRAAKALNIPVFSDFHTHFDQYSRYYRLGALLPLVKGYLRHLHNQSAVTLVPTHALKQELQQAGYQKLGIMERGVDTQLFNPQRRSEALRQSLGVTENQLLVILVTRLAREKNIDLAFHAFRDIQQQVPDARFVLVGDGPERIRLSAAYPDCLFAGMQHGAELATYYASADLFLYPSSSETFGNVITEAMASGLPVVAYDYAATARHIRHQQNGMAIPLEDEAAFRAAAVRLATDTPLRKSLAVQARHTGKQLNWSRVVLQLDQIIRKLLSEVRNENVTPSECSGNPGLSDL
ncbi:MAG: glycosyltransferase family 1 protein [Thiolinea sp.]